MQRHAVYVIPFCGLLGGALYLTPLAQAQDPGAPAKPVVAPAPGFHECRYPAGRPRAPQPPIVELVTINETEPNDSVAAAERIFLGTGPGFDQDFTINGSVANNNDVDFFRFRARRGEIVGASMAGAGALDSFLAIIDAAGTTLIANDDHNVQGTNLESLYPASSPFPGAPAALDSVFTWMCPADGTYFMRAQSFGTFSSGAYTIQIRLRPALLATNAPGRQIIFVDFDGATIDALTLFGVGNNPATLSGLGTFMTNWGLVNNAADRTAVIDAILAVITENLNDLTAQDPRMSFELRNSRDHADPFGQARVSRIIIGGTTGQLGFSVFGVSESIDPGNWGTEETCVVLLDLLSGACPSNNSLNCIPRAAGVGIVPLIGRVVGNIASHEIGHYFGNWHTDNTNATLNIMDAGGAGLAMSRAGAGADGTFGNGDDVDIDFVADGYDLNEAVANGVEATNLHSAYGLFFVPKLYVNRANNGVENGSQANPFNTVLEAVNAATAGVETWIISEAANYPALFSSAKRLVFRSAQGNSAFIGRSP